MFNIFKRVKKNEDDIRKAFVELTKHINDYAVLKNKVDKYDILKNKVDEYVEETDKLKRIIRYGRGDESNVIVDTAKVLEEDRDKGFRYTYDAIILRLYIDNEEYVIKDICGLRLDHFSSVIYVLNKQITVEGNIATVTISQCPTVEHVYIIDYKKGTYIHKCNVRLGEVKEVRDEKHI